MNKNLKDYQNFYFDSGSIMSALRVKCITEMYARSQPSVDYADILKYYKNCEKNGLKPDRIYNRYYLSNEEYEYILNKYINAYNLKECFKDHCDIIIRDLKDGYTNDVYYEDMLTKNGAVIHGDTEYEKVKPLSKIIGRKAAKYVLDSISNRKHFYRFDRAEENFRVLVGMGDSPCCNEQTVINYWKTQGKDIEIDPRHYTNDDFWKEENGYFDEEE